MHHSIIELCFVLCSLLIVSHLWFYIRVLRPIRRLAAQAEALTHGDFDALSVKCGGIPEITHLQRSLSSMSGHVRRAQEQSRLYASRLSIGQEAERQRIARDLHDETVQSLIAAAQSIDLIRVMGTTEAEHERFASIRKLLIESVSHLRDLIADLRPPALEELGLLPALEMQIAKLKPISADIKIIGEAHRLPESHEMALFRGAQEALNNVQRHSDATSVHITLDYQPSLITLVIRDNGKGFHSGQSSDYSVFNEHYGLLGIHERVTALDGTMTLTSTPGFGTTLTLTLPLRPVDGPDGTVRDPVCHTIIHPQQAYGTSEYEGKTYYFCCPVCQGAFHREPQFYLEDHSSLSPP
jgi:signal transduction histidine kinase/YHS domain-containing protein